MPYTIMPLREVLEGRVSQFLESLRVVREKAQEVATRVLSASFAGLTPEEGQIAEIPPRPEMFTGTTGATLSGTFRQNFTSTGWNTVLKANLKSAGEVKDKWVLGVAGIAILDPAKRVSQIQILQGDYSHPIIDIEDAFAEEGPVAVIFDVSKSNVDRFVFEPDKPFQLDAYIVATGYQTIKPIGVALVVKNTAIRRTYA